jgi:hypothetical protein
MFLIVNMQELYFRAFGVGKKSQGFTRRLEGA